MAHCEKDLVAVRRSDLLSQILRLEAWLRCTVQVHLEESQTA